MIAAIRTVLDKELRAWRYRFWWLPLAGALIVVLPMLFASPPRPLTAEDLEQQPWQRSGLMWSTVPAQPLAIVIAVLAFGAMALALWLARTMRWSEVHDDTLADLALSNLSAVEIAIGQVIGAWLITQVMLLGALPALIFYATMAGRSARDVAAGVLALALTPLFAAACGYGSMWWKRLTLLSVRGKSFRKFMLCFLLVILGAWTALAWPLSALGNEWAAIAPKPDFAHFALLGWSSFAWGPPLLALILLFFFVLHHLWQRGWRGRMLMPLFVATVAWAAVSASTPNSGWVTRLTSSLDRPGFLPQIYALITCTFGWAPFGATIAFGGQWATTGFTNACVPYLPLGIVTGLLYWAAIAVAAFAFAVGDLNWTMRNTWAIACLQNPARAALMSPESAREARRRSFYYPFATRNPVFDLCVARSTSARAALVGIFATLLLGFTLLAWFGYETYAKNPLERWQFDFFFALPLMATFLFCACCGWGCGLTIARMKRHQQWSALLATPMKFRSLLVGVCLPRWFDAATLMVLSGSLLAVALALRIVRPTRTDLEQYAVLFVFVALAAGISTATSVFASAVTKSAAKAGFLSVVLTVTGFVGFFYLSDWLEPAGSSEPSAWERLRPLFISTGVTGIALTLLAWIGCRRLRWDR